MNLKVNSVLKLQGSRWMRNFCL